MSTAVIGCGYWGKKIARILQEQNELAAICDTNPTQLESVKDVYDDIPRLTQIEDIWKMPGITRVTIVTPPSTHYSLAKLSLTHGKDVFVEKPLSLSSQQARELQHLAATQKCLLMVGHLINYHPAMDALCKWVKSGELGYFRKIETRRLGLGTFNKEVNVMWDLGVHDISIAIRLFKLGGFVLNESTVKSLQTSVFDGSQADTLMANAMFEENTSGRKAVFELHVSWLSVQKERLIKLIFDKGAVIWDATKAADDDSAVQVFKFRFDQNCPSRGVGMPSNGTATGRLVMPLDEEIRHFIECCQNRIRPLTDGSEGVQVVRLAELIHGASCLVTTEPLGVKNNKGVLQQTFAHFNGVSSNGVSNQNAHFNNVSFNNVNENGGGADYFAHPTAVIDHGVEIGAGSRVWHYSHISEKAKIGDTCNIGQNVFVAPKVVLGNRVKVQNNVSVYEGVICEDDVFLGPSMVFTNDRTPRSATRRPYVSTYVGRGASIGANATIVCGTKLGEYCMVGAGAVVTKDVPPFALVYGNPAKQKGWVTKDGDIVRSLPFPQENKVPPCFTLAAEWDIIGNEIRDSTFRVLKEGKFIKGPEVDELENQLATYVGVPYCITVANGTDALQVALMAIDVGPGDEVIVPAFTFIATAEVVSVLHAKPVFVDILPDTYNMNPASVQKAISPRTKAIMPVSLFGLVADLEAIIEVVRQTGRDDIIVIEDAAQSFGAKRDGKRSCGITDIACTSFFPTKPLGCYGDGGAIFTKSPHLANKIRSIANHGASDGIHSIVGINSRLDTIQAAVLLVKMKSFNKSIQSRQRVAEIYSTHLSQEPMISLPPAPKADVDARVFAQYTIRVDTKFGRDKLQQELKDVGVPTRIYYDTPLHEHPVFQHTIDECDCPVSEEAAKNVLSLPMFQYMTENEAMTVVSKVKQVLSAAH